MADEEDILEEENNDDFDTKTVMIGVCIIGTVFGGVVTGMYFLLKYTE